MKKLLFTLVLSTSISFAQSKDSLNIHYNVKEKKFNDLTYWSNNQHLLNLIIEANKKEFHDNYILLNEKGFPIMTISSNKSDYFISKIPYAEKITIDEYLAKNK
jgi:hypothetical protein